jgi:hypothetical protein
MAVKSFKPDDDRAFTITTLSGTIYKLSAPDALGYRTIRRVMAGRERVGSVIMTNSERDAAKEKREANPDKSKPAHKTFFKGRLVEPAAVNKQLTIEIFGENRTLISESVAQIDAS